MTIIECNRVHLLHVQASDGDRELTRKQFAGVAQELDDAKEARDFATNQYNSATVQIPGWISNMHAERLLHANTVDTLKKEELTVKRLLEEGTSE